MTAKRNDILVKLKLLYIPFIVMVVSLLLSFTLLNWLLVVKFHLLNLKQDWIEFWLPGIFSAVMVIVWLGRRFKILNLKTSEGRSTDVLYYMASIFLIALPTALTQPYMEKAAGKLTSLSSISDIDKCQRTNYYTLQHYFFEKNASSFNPGFKAIGKYNEDLVLSADYVVPIYGTVIDTISPSCKAWIGIEYKSTISNRGDQAEKRREIDEFFKESNMLFMSSPPINFAYIEMVPNSDEKDRFTKAVEASVKYKGQEEIIFQPVNQAFENRNDGQLKKISIGLIVALVVWFIMLIIPSINTKELNRLDDKKKTDKSALALLMIFFMPTKGRVVAPIIVSLNVLVFILVILFGVSLVSPNTSELITWGANFGPKNFEGQWWRLFTCMFLHAGIMHLLMNMFILSYISLLLENIVGSVKYAITYLLSGLIASVVSVCWHPLVASVGASGAIMGLFGMFLGLVVTKVFSKEYQKGILPFILTTVGYTLFVGIFMNADNAAHIGGLVSGFLLGLVFSSSVKERALTDKKHLGLKGIFSFDDKQEDKNVASTGENGQSSAKQLE